MSERDKKGDFRKPDGIITRGNPLGHSDEQGRVRGPDGIFLRGPELGYLDKEGQIRKPDGIFLRGQAVGQVKEKTAYDNDGIFLSGQEFGYVDDQGNVRLRDGIFLKGRIVGQARGNPQTALTFFVLQFQKIVEKADQLEREIESASDKTRFLGRVQSMLKWVPEANALGDFDTLLRRLKRLESQIERQLQDNKSKKETLIDKARQLSGSTDWRATTELIKDLQDRWKAIGPVPKADADALWERFRSAIDLFFTRKKEHAASREREQHANLSRKKHLIAKAESLASSNDWKSVGEAMKALQAEWKSVGHVPREQADALWQEFRHAQDRFYARRTANFEQRDREREKKQAEWRSHMRETLARKREQASRLEESIEHDQETVARWRDTIDNLRPGPKASEIRDSLSEKIYSVAEKIRSKRERLHELTAAIREIEAKL